MKWIRFFLLVIIVLFCTSCTKDFLDDNSIIINKGNDTDIISFRLTDNNNAIYEPFLVNDSTIHIYVGESSSIHSLALHLEHNGKSATIDGSDYYDGITLDFSDFLNPHKVSIFSPDGEVNNRNIIVYTLPVLILNTPNSTSITSKIEYTLGCNVCLYDGIGKDKYKGKASIKGRGNSTWLLPKKPYNIKLNKKYGFFCLPESKHWVLLANAYWDRTQMHNAIAYEMARLTDYPWVQSGRFVELLFNGTHQGLYFLCEKIRVEKNRINIKTIDSTDGLGQEFDGGYFLETAFNVEYNTFQTDYFNKTDAGNPLFWEIIEPEDESNGTYSEYIKSEINHIEKLLFNEDSVKQGTYRNYLDIENAINWMLVNEVSCNQETLNPSNLFLYRDRGGLLTFGPPWDFDAHTYGAYGVNKVFLQRSTFYFHWMLKDPVFVKRLKIKWEEYKHLWEHNIPLFIDELYDKIHQSALRNEKIWPDWQPVYYYPEKDYQSLIAEMKTFFFKQLQFVDDYIQDLNVEYIQ